jgi:hypothetical protein
MRYIISRTERVTLSGDALSARPFIPQWASSLTSSNTLEALKWVAQSIAGNSRILINDRPFGDRLPTLLQHPVSDDHGIDRLARGTADLSPGALADGQEHEIFPRFYKVPEERTPGSVLPTRGISHRSSHSQTWEPTRLVWQLRLLNGPCCMPSQLGCKGPSLPHSHQPLVCIMLASSIAPTARPFIALCASSLTSSNTLGSLKWVAALTMARARRSASSGGAKAQVVS